MVHFKLARSIWPSRHMTQMRLLASKEVASWALFITFTYISCSIISCSIYSALDSTSWLRNWWPSTIVSFIEQRDSILLLGSWGWCRSTRLRSRILWIPSLISRPVRVMPKHINTNITLRWCWCWNSWLRHNKLKTFILLPLLSGEVIWGLLISGKTS